MLRRAGKTPSDGFSRNPHAEPATLNFMPPAALNWKENTLRYRIRESSKAQRPQIGLLVTGRPAEPEPKRGRCSAGPAKFHQTVFYEIRAHSPRHCISCLLPRLTGRKKPFANRIRELSKVRRPLIHLLVMGRPAELELKRERCSAKPAKLY